MVKSGDTINIKFTKEEIKKLEEANIKKPEEVQKAYENGAKRIVGALKK